jgi:hypothetical protein
VRHFLSDLAELGTHSGGTDDRLAPPVGYGSARKHHVLPISDGRVDAHRCGLLDHRQRFPGKRRLVALERVILDDPRVGGYLVPGLEHHDVARDEVLGGHLFLLAVAQHGDHGRQHAFQRVERLFRAKLLDEAQHRAEHDNDADDDRVDILANEGGKRGRNDQNYDQNILELIEEKPPRRGPFLLCQLVRTVLGKPLVGVLGRQAALRIYTQLLDRSCCFQGMPR